MMKGLIMKPQLYPAQRRHLERYAQGRVAGFNNTRSEHKLLELGFIERCDEIVRYTETVTWTIYKARITQWDGRIWRRGDVELMFKGVYGA